MPEAYNTSPPSIEPGDSTSETWIPIFFNASRTATSSPCRELAPYKTSTGSEYCIFMKVQKHTSWPRFFGKQDSGLRKIRQQNVKVSAHRMRDESPVANHHGSVLYERAVREFVISWQLNHFVHESCQPPHYTSIHIRNHMVRNSTVT